MAESEDDFVHPQPSVGDRLRAAREAKKLSLEDIAEQTRIPLRHLQNLEAGEWSALPAPTYTIGFAKSYASAVGLDRTEIGDDLRDEMGGVRYDAAKTEVFEPADPARAMPKWLVLSAIGAIILVVVVMTWLNNRALSPDQPVAPAPQETATAPARTEPAATTAPAPAQTAEGPVTLTAVEPAWIRVTDQGKTLFEGVLPAGQIYSVPQTASAPLLRAGAPEALRVNVGTAVAPPIGPAGKVASNVSLKPVDLMRGPAAAVTTVPAPSAPPAVQNTAG
jgi:cytoskeleton protein RodZ